MVDAPRVVYEQTTCTFTCSLIGYYTTVAVGNYLLLAIKFMEFLQVRFVWFFNISTTTSRSLASRFAFSQLKAKFPSQFTNEHPSH